MDPGNYSTDVSAGAQFRFKLLFVIFLSNVFAILLQSLACKLGSVTGMDLARCSREYFPFWLNILLYIVAEFAIIATDIAEVIGTAIALNMLLHIPLVAGVALTSIDVLIVLMAYRPEGSLKGMRYFEWFVAMLVLGVIACFVVELIKMPRISFTEVMQGFLPNGTIISHGGLYAALGILGATVMPHSLFLGSGLVQVRMRDYDEKAGNFIRPRKSIEQPRYTQTWKQKLKSGLHPSTWFSSKSLTSTNASEELHQQYRPSIAAIKSTLKYSVLEVTISLFTLAFFVNSAILIVAGATLSNSSKAAEADLFTIKDLLSEYLTSVAGTLFALALLFSGQSAGIVATMAGQMVSEGFLKWKVAPWLRRLITRGIAIIPSIIVAAAVGRPGLGRALNASQVSLSILLPIVTAPLIYITGRKKYMRVPISSRNNQTAIAVIETGAETEEAPEEILYHFMENGWLLTGVSWLVWLIILGFNMYLIVLLAQGKA
ncbi:unnamed protein product [Didymodactylos carnosus]|uniref:Natural resistance-associated macrophage protein n=1 Tax=Didymodactylos carnosus TaxID=1234261 RepID=A0A815A7Y6_9BILA|nr:unnamed protein product [Didymodactylos carnosus]CAF4020425.1 unnamed protein product [Didymodactylos carnosus]